MFDAAQMLVIKEGAGHKQYELERKVNDELIHAAMKGDVEKLRLSLESSANPNASRDMYNLESLHYAKVPIYIKSSSLASVIKLT